MCVHGHLPFYKIEMYVYIINAINELHNKIYTRLLDKHFNLYMVHM